MGHRIVVNRAHERRAVPAGTQINFLILRSTPPSATCWAETEPSRRAGLDPRSADFDIPKALTFAPTRIPSICR